MTNAIDIHCRSHDDSVIENAQLKVVNGELRSLDDKPVKLVDFKDNTKVFVLNEIAYAMYRQAYVLMKHWAA